VDDAQRLIDALSSPIRREILWLVWDSELPAGEIAEAFEVSSPTISQHLTVLRNAGLVSMRVDGTFRRYKAIKSAVQSLQAIVPSDKSKWTSSVAPRPEASLAGADTTAAVVAAVDADCQPADAFVAFTDAAIYSHWLGAPVSLVDGRFSCTLAWGVGVRGTYDLVHAPSLIVMTWDFDEVVPAPGAARRAYLNISPRDGGCHLEVHQLVTSNAQAVFMEGAWRFVLGCFAANGVEALRAAGISDGDRGC
jgi:DNA-binding transcriptional ArsR family regulator/uncharacterized protein YndB with AHSA1/START domain